MLVHQARNDGNMYDQARNDGNHHQCWFTKPEMMVIIINVGSPRQK
jgi:hypothetical protein